MAQGRALTVAGGGRGGDDRIRRYAQRFVTERSNPIGFGWCEGVKDGLATVQYFDLPDSVAEERRVPIADIVVQDLPMEMRIWVRNKGFGWWPGRIKGKERKGSYFVQLAGVKPIVRIPPWSIQVRWDQPLDSATAALAIGMTDSPGYYSARSAVIANLVNQRAVTRGFTGLLSASVLPYRHQVDVMTRVLNDPVMRFVLADEVGLGKTIEAGLIVRQLFLDKNDSSVAIFTPRTLRHQWTDELRGKLRLGQQLRSGALRVRPHEDLFDSAPLTTDLLVIDEAHRLLDGASADHARMEALNRIAEAVPALLLLTATPLRDNAETFLGLLHLIDPMAYHLGDLNEFQRRLEIRCDQASSIELLSIQMPRTVVRSVLTEFASSYGDDRRLQGLLEVAIATLDAGSSMLEQALAAVTDHMRETYRLSRRVIRTRRGAVSAEGFPVSGRRLQVVALHDPSREVSDEFLDQWRRCLLGDGSQEIRSEACFAQGVEAALAGSSALIEFIDSRLATIDSVTSGTEDSLLRQTRAVLKRRRANARLVALANLVPKADARLPKTVIFSGFTGSAREAAEHLSETYGRQFVALHLEDMTPESQDTSIERFFNDPACRALICDASGEEGRNLEKANQLIHLDLPLSVNRLEQRIGRTDRFNPSASLDGGVPSIVFAEVGSPWVSGLLHLLTEGVRIFEESVATLQRPLAEYEVELSRRLLGLGVEAFGLDVAELRSRLDDERNQIDLLEELEATLTTREFSPADLGDLIQFERSWPAIAEAFTDLTSQDGGIRLKKSDSRGTAGEFTYGVDPALQTIPLMAAHHQSQLLPLLRQVRTFDRAVALADPNVQLERLGDPLVNWIEEYLRIDEGGRARAVWRHVPGWTAPEAWFCFDFVLEFDEHSLERFDRGTRRRLRRRGDAFLPPRFERVWTDGQAEASPALVNSVLEPVVGQDHRDIALRGPRWAPVLDRFPEWGELCARAECHAREILGCREEIVDWRAAAERVARSEVEWRAEVLRLWSDRLPCGAEQDRARRQTEMEESLGRDVVDGITNPRLTLFAIGGFVLAGVSLDA
jgi:superfamily II DNA or RNA helicase